MKIEIERTVHKFLDNLDAKQYRQIVRKMLPLANDQRPSDSRKLIGYNYFRTDIGEFRIIYRFDADTVYIVLAGKRNDDDVYKTLSRL